MDVPQVADWYFCGCINLDRLRNPRAFTHISQGPALTMKNRDNGVDETGAFSRASVSYTPEPASFPDSVSIPVLPAHRRLGRGCLHARDAPREPRAPPAHCVHPANFHSESPLYRDKQTLVNAHRAVYSYADQVADRDERIPPVVCTLVSDARAYLTRDQPIKTHAIWTSLNSWNKEHSHLLTGNQPDFCTWWDQSLAQAQDHHIPASIA